MSKAVRNFNADTSGMSLFTKMVRSSLKLNEGDRFEAVYNANCITVRKTGKLCFVCGTDEDLQKVGNKLFCCSKCMVAINKVYNKARERQK